MGICSFCLEDNHKPNNLKCAKCKGRRIIKTPIWRFKTRCRAASKEYFKRGQIKKTTCQGCGDSNVEMHHPDYTKRKLIIWFCKKCHFRWPRENKAIIPEFLRPELAGAISSTSELT